MNGDILFSWCGKNKMCDSWSYNQPKTKIAGMFLEISMGSLTP